VSNPPLKTIYGTSEPKQDGKLTRLVVPDLHPRAQTTEARPQQRPAGTTAARRSGAGETLAAAAVVALALDTPGAARNGGDSSGHADSSTPVRRLLKRGEEPRRHEQANTPGASDYRSSRGTGKRQRAPVRAPSGRLMGRENPDNLHTARRSSAGAPPSAYRVSAVTRLDSRTRLVILDIHPVTPSWQGA
jgi:hypothetical protein